MPSPSVASFILNTKALQSLKTPGTTQHHNHTDTNLEQHKCVNLKLIATVKIRGTLQKYMKTEDVRNTKAVALILLQHSAYRQVKIIQSHGVWVSSLMNQNYIQEEITSRLQSGNACYHSVQNLFSSNLLSKNIKVKIHRTIILLVVLFGCETWSLTLRDESRVRVFDHRVLRRIFGPKRYEVTWEWRKLHNEALNGLYSSK